MDPFNVVKSAIDKVPAMKYALAVACLAAVVTVALGFNLKSEVAVFGALVVIGLMFVLLLFSRYAGERDSRGLAQATVLAWFYTIAVMACTTLFITSYFWKWPVSFAASAGEQTPSLIPVTLTAVRKDSLAPETRTIFTVLDPTSRLIRQEVVPDVNGQASFELPAGKYELQTIGADKNLSFEVSPPKTIITVQIGAENAGPVLSTIVSETVGVGTRAPLKLPSPLSRRPAELTLASVLLRPDVGCVVSMDDKDVKNLQTGEVVRVPIGEGQHLVRARNPVSGFQIEKTISVSGSAQQIVDLPIGAEETAALQASRDKAAKEAVEVERQAAETGREIS